MIKWQPDQYLAISVTNKILNQVAHSWAAILSGERGLLRERFDSFHLHTQHKIASASPVEMDLNLLINQVTHLLVAIFIALNRPK